MFLSPQILASRPKARVAGGGGGGPPGVTGLLAWLDASVTASMTLSGSSIINMADQSGSGNHFGDGSASGKPTYSATGFNTSHPTMVFATQSISSTSTFPMGTGNTLTFAMVGTLGSSAETDGRAISYRAGLSNDYNNVGNWIFFRNGNTTNVGIMRNLVSALKSISADTPYRFVGTIDSSGVMTIYVNGVASTTSTSSGNWLNNGVLALGLGTDGSHWNGVMSEIIVATGYSDATAVASLDSWLQTKWGL